MKNEKAQWPVKIGGVELDYTFYTGQDQYNEGDAEEQAVLDVFKNERDVLEVLAEDDRWPVLYQLSPERRVIAEPMDLRETDHMLEIGAGMGAVTAAFAPRVERVDCVELSARRAAVNGYRNARYDNIRIYVGNYEDVELPEQYDVVSMIGVLEYASLYIHAQGDPAEAMLRRINSQMKPGGRLYVAIENRLGMKYFAGHCEDHTGQPYVGITGYSGGGTAVTYSKSELESRLKNAGFGSLYFYYPFPDYKLPSVIYSDDMPWGDTLPQNVSFQGTNMQAFDAQLAQLSLRSTAEFSTFANSFLVEAVKTA